MQWKGRGAALKAILNGKTINGTRDFGGANGLYALYKDYRLVYIGQAYTRPLGRRLREHRADHKAGRWDKFSWFSVSLLTANGFKAPPSLKIITARDMVKTLEAIGIVIADPPLNRQRMKIPGAVEVKQVVPKQDEDVSESIQRIDRTLIQMKDLLNVRKKELG